MKPFPEILQSIVSKIRTAAESVGRDANEISLVAVTKTVPIEKMEKAIQAGVGLLGENRIQEAITKIAVLRPLYPSIKWHFIGHLQANKIHKAVEHFDMIQSIDSRKLAERVNESAGRVGKQLPILVQVSLAKEEMKSGVDMEALPDVIAAIAQLPNLSLKGLMAIPPYFPDPEEARPYFRTLRQLAENLNARQVTAFPLKELSMGMSHDFHIAIQEGATMIRLGTALFGERV